MSSSDQSAILQACDASRIFDLSVEYFVGMPSWTAAKDPKYEIWMTHTPQGTIHDGLSGMAEYVHRTYSYSGSAISMYSHVGTHLCSLNHIGLLGRFWNGWKAETHLGSRAWTVGGVFPPIIARAVLLDIAAVYDLPCLPESYAIGRADIDAALRRLGVGVRQGDIALIRTGQMVHWPEQEKFMKNPPGLGMEAARYLCEELGVMCIGVDCGGEALPPQEPNSFLPVHAYLFATAGTPLFENLWLEEIADAAVYQSVLLAFPLKLRGSTGVPVRPIAIPLRA
jgi:kynurenine formamidase